MARKFNDAVDLANNELQNVVLQNLASDPGTGLVDGRIWYDTALDVVRVRANGASVTLQAGAGYTDEQAQDAVAAALAAGTHTGGLGVTYNDASNSLSLTLANNEAFQDIVGAFLEDDAGSTGITATYDDTNGRVNLAVAYAAPNLTLGTANAAGSANTAMRTDATILAFDATAPTTVAFGAAAATGSAAVAARRDHTHAGPTHGLTQHQELIATADLTDWPRSAALDLNGQKITGLADGTAATDAATFGQLSAAVAGFDWKEPVQAGTTPAIGNITLSGGAPNALDGVTLAVGMRILVKDQTNHAQDGVYSVTTLGTGANGTWARTGDVDSAAEVNNATVLILDGTVNRGDVWRQNATIATFGTDAQAWVKVSEGNQTYSADGTTLTLTGTTFSIANGGVGATQLATAVAGAGLAGGGGTALSVNAGTGLEISGDDIRIAAAAAGDGLTGGGGSALAVGVGTGMTVAANAVGLDRATNGSKVAFIYAAALAGGAATETVTHNLGSRDVIVIVYGPSGTSYAEEEFSVEHTDANTVLIRSATTIPASTYRVVIFG